MVYTYIEFNMRRVDMQNIYMATHRFIEYKFEYDREKFVWN